MSSTCRSNIATVTLLGSLGLLAALVMVAANLSQEELVRQLQQQSQFYNHSISGPETRTRRQQAIGNEGSMTNSSHIRPAGAIRQRSQAIVDKQVHNITTNGNSSNKRLSDDLTAEPTDDWVLPGLDARVRTHSAGGNVSISPRPRNLDDISHRLDQVEQPVSQSLDFRVPFWNIAHMINSIEQIELALNAGSNGIETDVSFDAQGRPVEAFHGVPCDCGRHCYHREDFVKFVRHLGRLGAPPASNRLFVVLFDLKLKELEETSQKVAAGRNLAKIINEQIYEPYQRATNIRSRSTLDQRIHVQPPIRAILSINHARDVALVRAFIGYMIENRLDFMRAFVGFDVGMNDDLGEIQAAWDELKGATMNIWQGDGLTNCANIVRGVDRLKSAIEIRNGQGHFRKVYYWTADVKYHIRAVLRLGIDALLTNQPQRVVQVLAEDEFRHKYRLATAYDDPYEQFWMQGSNHRLPAPSLGELAETIANIRETGHNFIKTLPDGIAAAFKRVVRAIDRAL